MPYSLQSRFVCTQQGYLPDVEGKFCVEPIYR